MANDSLVSSAGGEQVAHLIHESLWIDAYIIGVSLCQSRTSKTEVISLSKAKLVAVRTAIPHHIYHFYYISLASRASLSRDFA